MPLYGRLVADGSFVQALGGGQVAITLLNQETKQKSCVVYSLDAISRHSAFYYEI